MSIVAKLPTVEDIEAQLVSDMACNCADAGDNPRMVKMAARGLYLAYLKMYDEMLNTLSEI